MNEMFMKYLLPDLIKTSLNSKVFMVASIVVSVKPEL